MTPGQAMGMIASANDTGARKKNKKTEKEQLFPEYKDERF
jgi:hypothetical protein